MTNTTDPNKWLLYSSNLTTRIGNDLPALSSHLYFEINQPGSGEVKIPLDSIEANLVATGQFVQCWYRGSQRGGFFIDNIVPQEINTNEYSGRVLSITGRGALSLLDTEIVYNDNTGSTKRVFSAMSKAAILKQLIDEAKARGSLTTLTYDFTATLDSHGIAWADSEDYEISVGKKLLDVARDFCKTGTFDFDINLSGSSFILSAYKNGLGTDVSSNIKLRAGGSIQEMGKDQRGGKELVNVYLAKYKNGFVTVKDNASIASHGRNVDFLNIEQAQTSTSAMTYASAKLALNKEPKSNKPVKLWDGNAPYVFIDYNMGDTVTLDKFGTETQDRILGLQLEFSGDNYAIVSIDFNTIFYDNELNIASQLDDLQDQWASAQDAGLLETRQWLSIGQPDGYVYTLHIYNGVLYIGGAFTAIGNVYANHVAQYNLSTGLISATDATGMPSDVLKILDIAGELYAITSTNIYHFLFGSWVSIGVATLGTTINDMTTDGTNLYVCGMFNDISGVATNHGVGKWNGSVWSSVSGTGSTGNAWGIIWFANTLWIVETAIPATNVLKKLVTGSWVAQLTGISKSFSGLGTDGNYIYFRNDLETHLYQWDGVGPSPVDFINTTSGALLRTPYTLYLADLYIGGTFIAGDSSSPIRYSGGLFSYLAEGTPHNIFALATNNGDIYAGGNFTLIGGQPINYLAVYITNFQSLVNHLSTSDNNTFDLGAAINNATPGTITSTGKIPFWDSVTGALRSITWANIIALLDAIFPAHTLSTAENDFLVGGVGGTANTWVKKTLNEVKSILGLGSMAYQNVNGWLSDAANTWTYSSADSPTGVISINEDMTDTIEPGDKVKYNQDQALTAYWNMDANSNSQVGSFNGTDTAMSYTAGKFSNAATFNGTTSKIVFTDNASLKPTGEFTAGLWFKTSNTGSVKTLFASFSGNPNPAGFNIAIDATNVLRLYAGKGTGTTVGVDYALLYGPTVVTDGNWHYVVHTYRNNYYQIYLDGKLELAAYIPGIAYAATNYVRIGVQNNTGTDVNFMNGQIDDVFLINGYALDEFTIAQKYKFSSAQGTGNITVTKMGIITKVGAFSGGATLITVYHGNDFMLANATISSPYYSHFKNPFYFNINPAKWTVFYQNYGTATQAPPVVGTFYNAGTQIVVAPIGVWDLEWEAYIEVVPTATGSAKGTISTANNTESSAANSFGITISAIATWRQQFTKLIKINAFIKTNLYINIAQTGGAAATSISYLNAAVPTTVRLICAFL